MNGEQSTHRDPFNELEKHGDKEVDILFLLSTYMEFPNDTLISVYWSREEGEAGGGYRGQNLHGPENDGEGDGKDL